MLNKEKILCHGPCALKEYNGNTQSYITYYPDVDCECLCETCGWNPSEQKRRLRTGEMKPVFKRINHETGKVVHLDGMKVKQLCFNYPIFTR